MCVSTANELQVERAIEKPFNLMYAATMQPIKSDIRVRDAEGNQSINRLLHLL